MANPIVVPNASPDGLPVATEAERSDYLAESGELRWRGLISSNLKAVAISDDNARMYVKFQPDGYPETQYVYFGVPRWVFTGLLDADSAGKYLDKYVKKAGYDHKQLY